MRPPSPPAPLLEAIRSGQCVAFVGAGFSAAAGLPGWVDLLLAIADHLPPDDELRGLAERALRDRVHHPSSRELESLAQLLRDRLGDEAFEAALTQAIGEVEPTERMRRRLRLLKGIPFRAILTTNFDPLLQGALPGPSAYWSLLRPSPRPWWDPRFWPDAQGDVRGPEVVKLHGSIEPDGCRDVVFARSDFRRRVYGTPGYTPFLQALFATQTVLYLGFSFTDAYLNELRARILAFVEHTGAREHPIAYAVLPDVSEVERRYLLVHEGLQVLPYQTEGCAEHRGFDAWLQALHDTTNAVHQLGLRLQGRRLLWVDPNVEGNEDGRRFLARAAEEAGGDLPVIEMVRTVDEALVALRRERFDLVISRWGHAAAHADDGHPCASAEALLARLHAERIRVPVLVFSSGDHADQNKAAALRAGAAGFVYRWESLFRTVDVLLAPGSETG